MAEILLPDADLDRTAFGGAGPHPGEVWTLTWHSTESGPGSIEGTRSWLQKKSVAPNVLVEFHASARGGRRVIQMVDLGCAAKALKNTSTPGQTNKAGTVQVEVIMRASDPVEGTTPDDWRWLGWVGGEISRLVGVPVEVPIAFHPYPPDRERPPQYLGREPWRILDDSDDATVQGWVGHQHWAENAHGDPGDWSSPDPRLGGRTPISLMLEGAGATPKDWFDLMDEKTFDRKLNAALDARFNPDGKGNLLPRIRDELAKQGPRSVEMVKGVRKLLSRG